MSGDERQDVLAVLRDVQERLDRQGARYWNETRALNAERGLLRAERDSLLLRGKDAGVSHTDMAKVLGETRQQVQVYVQEAQQAESNACSQLVEDARVDGLMRDRGITEAEARTIVYEERDAASRAASKARPANDRSSRFGSTHVRRASRPPVIISRARSAVVFVFQIGKSGARPDPARRSSR